MSQERTALGVVAAIVIAVVAGAAYFLLHDADPMRSDPKPAVEPRPAEIEKTSKSPPIPATTGEAVKSTPYKPGEDRPRPDDLFIAGMVRKADGAPIMNAKVELVFDLSAMISRAQEGDVRGGVLTPTDGQFLFSQESCPACGLSLNDRYLLRVSHPDYATERITGIELRDPRTTLRDVVLSTTPSKIGGFARDEQGGPIAGAEVKVYDLSVGSQDPEGALERSATTDGAGAYLVTNLKPGQKRVWATRSGYASTGRPSFNIDAAKPDERIDFVMRPGFWISGAVISQETGLGVEGALITVRATRMGPPVDYTPLTAAETEQLRSRSAKGGASGLLPAGGAMSKDGLRALREAANLDAAGRDAARGSDEAKRQLMDALERRGKGGEQKGGGGERDPSPHDDLSPEQIAERRRQQDAAAFSQAHPLTTLAFRTGPDGRFKADGLEQGGYQLAANAVGYAAPPQQSAETGSDAVKFELISNGRIVGQVVDDETGKPVASFTVGFAGGLNLNSAPYHLRKSFGPPKFKDGAFDYTDVKPGTYTLIAEAPGFAGGRSEPITVGQSERREGVVIRLVRGASLKGRVLDAQGRPVADAEVSVDAGGPPTFLSVFESNMRRDRKETRSDKSGAFVLSNVLEGRYVLKVKHPRYGPYESEAFDMPKAGEVVRPDLTLNRGALVRGRVLNGDGSPDSAAMVQVVPVQGAALTQRQAQSDSEGRYEVDGLAPGQYKIMCMQRAGKIDMREVFRGITAGGNSPFGAPAGPTSAGLAPPTIYTLTEGQTFDLDF